jgi:hypothetical protein
MRPIPADEENYFESRVCTAQFKMTSLDVMLRITVLSPESVSHVRTIGPPSPTSPLAPPTVSAGETKRNIELKRQKVLSTRYSFVSPALTVGGASGLVGEASGR